MKMTFWEEDEAIPSGHQLLLKQALRIVITKIFHKLLLPNWALGLTENLRNVDLGFKELEVCPSYVHCIAYISD